MGRVTNLLFGTRHRFFVTSILVIGAYAWFRPDSFFRVVFSLLNSVIAVAYLFLQPFWTIVFVLGIMAFAAWLGYRWLRNRFKKKA